MSGRNSFSNTPIEKTQYKDINVLQNTTETKTNFFNFFSQKWGKSTPVNYSEAFPDINNLLNKYYNLNMSSTYSPAIHFFNSDTFLIAFFSKLRTGLSFDTILPSTQLLSGMNNIIFTYSHVGFFKELIEWRNFLAFQRLRIFF